MMNCEVSKTCSSEDKWFLYECFFLIDPVPSLAPSLSLPCTPPSPWHSLLLLAEGHWLLWLVLKLGFFELLSLFHVQEKNCYSIAGFP